MSKFLTYQSYETSGNTGSRAEFSRSPRFAGLFAVAGLHVGVVIALITGLNPRDVISFVDPPIITDVMIDETPVEAEPVPDVEMTSIPTLTVPRINIAPAGLTAISTDFVETRVTGTVTPPEEWRISKPVYPAAARRAEQEGVVTLLLYIDEEGQVQSAKIEKSSGFTLLDEAAYKQALKGWRFKPAKKNGVPYAVWHSIPVEFVLIE